MNDRRRRACHAVALYIGIHIYLDEEETWTTNETSYVPYEEQLLTWLNSVGPHAY